MGRSPETDPMAPRGPAQRIVAPPAALLSEYALAALAMAACTAVNFVVFRYLSLSDVAMVYLLGIGLVAARFRRGPTIFASFLSIALFDFNFVPPRFTFGVAELRYLVTFAVMLATALVISALTLRIREQAATAKERERRTAALYAMSRELAGTRGVMELTAVAVRHFQDTFAATVQFLLPDGRGQLQAPPGTLALNERERSAAQWAFEHGRTTGSGTAVLAGTPTVYLPMPGSGGVIGVVGVRMPDPARLNDPARREHLEAFVTQAGLALERATLADRAQREQVEVEAERLRTSLLSSLSHDLRTPLGAITGAASSLLESPSALSETARRDLLATILEESQRMNRLIGNLLDMIRVESGSLTVQKEWQPLEESVGVALIRLADPLGDRPVTVSLPPDLPLVPVDGVLLEQVFINLLENALKYTPPASPIEITAQAGTGAVVVTVADRGPGIPPGEETRIFGKLYRSASVAGTGGSGLGLSICHGVVTAHGGRIWAENRPDGGAAFHFSLPMSGPPPEAPPAEAET